MGVHLNRVGPPADRVAGVSEPAYTRLDVEERRRRLLELGTELFARHDYDALSMAAIAREAGISKALLYHYFPSKQAYFVATLEQKAAELAALIAPDPALAPARAARGQPRRVPGLGGGERRRLREARARRGRGAGGARGDGGGARGDRRADPRRVAGAADARCAARRCGRGCGSLDGAILDWLEHRDLTREELHTLLLRALEGALGEPL